MKTTLPRNSSCPVDETNSVESADRRTSERVISLYRIARIRTDQDEGLARVQNITDNGMKLQLHFPVHLGDSIIIQTSDDTILKGQVIWDAGNDCGVRLDEGVVSPWGKKVERDGSHEVTLRRASGLATRGVVRWSREGIVGILLLEPFTAQGLGSISKF